MSVAAWLVLGFGLGGIVGWFARARGRDLVASIVVGVLGGFLGGFLASALLGLSVTELEPASIGVAVLGALVLALFLRAIPATDVFE
jgi:uncharacterized membrane protein YeaQ/YmgE (transglycosylase-associated protein family)